MPARSLVADGGIHLQLLLCANQHASTYFKRSVEVLDTGNRSDLHDQERAGEGRRRHPNRCRQVQFAGGIRTPSRRGIFSTRRALSQHNLQRSRGFHQRIRDVPTHVRITSSGYCETFYALDSAGSASLSTLSSATLYRRNSSVHLLLRHKPKIARYQVHEALFSCRSTSSSNLRSGRRAKKADAGWQM